MSHSHTSPVLITASAAAVVVRGISTSHGSGETTAEPFVLRLSTTEQVRVFLDELFAAADDYSTPVPCGTLTLGGTPSDTCSISARIAVHPPEANGAGAQARLVVTAHSSHDTAVDILDLDMQQLGDLHDVTNDLAEGLSM